MAKASIRDRNAHRHPVIRDWSAEAPFYSRRLQRMLGMVSARRHHSKTLSGLNRFLRQRKRNPMAARPRPVKIMDAKSILAMLAAKKENP